MQKYFKMPAIPISNMHVIRICQDLGYGMDMGTYRFEVKENDFS
jgi:hypothetical protein